MTRLGEERLHEAWQQSEALDDHTRFPWEAEDVFNDHAEALAPEPVECLKHGFRGSVHPSLVHGQELAQERAVLGCAPAGVIGHYVVGRVEMQTMLSRYATSDGRLARTAAASDPVNVLELFVQCCGLGSLSLSFMSHPSGLTNDYQLYKAEWAGRARRRRITKHGYVIRHRANGALFVV